MYPGQEPIFGKLIVLIVVLSLIIFIFNTIMRKILKVKRTKFFSQTHVNDLHKKGDRIIVILTVIATIVAAIIFYDLPSLPINNSLAVFMVSMVFLFLQEVFHAIIEWKYKKGQNDYLYTIFQLIFVLIVGYFAFQSGGFGLFPDLL
ncbi:DUF4181 domain-containing protein [Virgibacillus litoralis]|uniref:Magnesium-transporting ATPase (P-type) n=1 Tax=Virgibacillus litoralis TaxID=578221 RepID=A0ABS4HEN2_9BACI|nr:DUF4181 domain-containing protein [Virgibacillus litoralis]MBP1949366.1 magnesium-transporting ATPase (P-type) [Virgibacillus litoralis]